MAKRSGFQFMVLSALLLILFSCCMSQGNSQVQQNSLSIHRSGVGTASVPGDTVHQSGRSIFYIFQAKDHTYWFGSDGEGVYHYDGKKTVRYTTNQGLCHNRVRGIQEDSAGTLFVNTLAGISRFNGKTFLRLPVGSESLSAAGWKLDPNDLWFEGAQDSGLVYRYDGKTLHRLKFPKTALGEDFIARFPRSQYPTMAFNPYDVYTIYKDSKGHVWFGTGNLGACRYNGTSFDWISGDELAESGDGPSNGVRSVIEDREGNFRFSNTQYRYILSGTGTGEQEKSTFQYKREKGIGSLDGKKDGTLYDYLWAAKDASGDLWMVTYNAGVWRYDGKKIIHYPVTENGNAIRLFSVYKDRQGDLWLGTHKSGVYKFNGRRFE